MIKAGLELLSTTAFLQTREIGETRSQMSSLNSLFYECLSVHVMIDSSVVLTAPLHSVSLPAKCRVWCSEGKFDSHTKSTGRKKIAKNPRAFASLK